MRPRQFTFAIVFAALGALIGWGIGSALNQSQAGWSVVLAIIGVAVGIGVGRYLGSKSRVKAAVPTVDVHGDKIGG